ncbi:MAG TPA: hypothetical protein VK718_10485 [Ferruginibacter sp.]|jgi:hypothetical protein|nr:hypothetical protein [Ferruginibacter sp.]
MKNLIIFAALVLLFASCKKSSSGTITAPNSISATIKGDNISFMNSAYSYTDIDGSNPIDYYFEGEANDSLGNFLEVSFDSYYKNFSTRTFGIVGDSTTDAYVYFSPETGGSYYNYTGDGPSPILITLTSIGSSMQGTFKGELYLNGNPSSSDSIYISDGKFSIYQ